MSVQSITILQLVNIENDEGEHNLFFSLEGIVVVVFLTAANHNVRNAHAVLMKRSYSVVGFRLTG